MFIKILTISLLFSLVGCAGSPGYNYPTYNQASPVIDTVKENNYTSTSRRRPGSVRYEETTTLEAAVKQADEVMIMVTFRFVQRRNREPRTSNCELHIKSSDRSVFSRGSCKITPAAGTFIVSFTNREYGSQSFDLESLGGHFVGRRPPYRSSRYYYYIGDPNRQETFRYDYIGKDPFNY